jgi:hypothetical protein
MCRLPILCTEDHGLQHQCGEVSCKLFLLHQYKIINRTRQTDSQQIGSLICHSSNQSVCIFVVQERRRRIGPIHVHTVLRTQGPPTLLRVANDLVGGGLPGGMPVTKHSRMVIETSDELICFRIALSFSTVSCHLLICNVLCLAVFC